ncbi:MAG: hypothetical protein ACRDGE_09840 [Candidatus Limnocylindria bacterium]
MWRLVVVASLLLTLALGTAASAKCRICVESVGAISSGSSVTLEVVARSMAGDELPDRGTAVVMQFDGQPSKCLNVTLAKVDEDGGVATYSGTFNGAGTSTYSGRVDIAGAIYEFTVSVNGAPVPAGLVADPPAVTSRPAVAAAQPAPLAPRPAPLGPAPAPPAAPGLELPALPQGTTLLAIGLLVTVTVSTYLDRKRALERSRAG